MGTRIAKVEFEDGDLLWASFSTTSGSMGQNLIAASVSEIRAIEVAEDFVAFEVARRPGQSDAVGAALQLVVISVQDYGSWWGVADRANQKLLCGFNADDCFGGVGLEKTKDELYQAICPSEWMTLEPMTVAEAIQWARGDLVKAATGLQVTWASADAAFAASAQDAADGVYVERMRKAYLKQRPMSGKGALASAVTRIRSLFH